MRSTWPSWSKSASAQPSETNRSESVCLSKVRSFAAGLGSFCSIVIRHHHLPRDPDGAADSAGLILARGERAGKVDEHRPGVGRHPFAEQPRRCVLKLRHGRFSCRGHRGERLLAPHVAERVVEGDLRRGRQAVGERRRELLRTGLSIGHPGAGLPDCGGRGLPRLRRATPPGR